MGAFKNMTSGLTVRNRGRSRETWYRWLPRLALLLGLTGLFASLYCFHNARKTSEASGNYQNQVSELQQLSGQMRSQWTRGAGRESMQPQVAKFWYTHDELQGGTSGVDLPQESARLANNVMQAFEQWLQSVPQSDFPEGVANTSEGVANTSEQNLSAAGAASSASLGDDLGYLTEATGALRARLAKLGSPEVQIEPAGHLFQLSLTLRKRLIENVGATSEELRATRGPWLVFDQILERLEAMLGTREITDSEAVQLTSDIRAMQVALDGRLGAIFSGDSTVAEAEANAALEAAAAAAAGENQQLMTDLATRHDLLDDTIESLQVEVANSPRADSLWYTLGLLSGLLGTGILTLLALGLMRSLVRERARQVVTHDQHEESILQLLNEISRLAEGDLNTRATVNEGITGSIADSVNYAVSELRRLVGTMSTSAERVQIAVEETGTTARQLANASVVQSREISRSSAYTQAMASTMQQLSTRSSEAKAIATRSLELSSSARAEIKKTAGNMQSVKQQTAEANRVMNRLGDSSMQISRSIKLIDQVAEKTRLLAMNTAIRARGRNADSSASLVSDMAEVAEQIQGLSNRLGQSAGEIETLVSVVQQDVAATVEYMQAIDHEVDSVAGQTEKAAKSLEQIEAVSTRLDSIVSSIDERTQRQNKVIGQLSSNMGVINDVTRHSAHGLQLSASSLEDLRLMASELKDSVAEFSLPETDQQAIRLRVEEIRNHEHVGAHSETMVARFHDNELTMSASQSMPQNNSGGSSKAINLGGTRSGIADTDHFDERTIAIESEIAAAVATSANEYNDNRKAKSRVKNHGEPGRNSDAGSDTSSELDSTQVIDESVKGTRQ